MRIAFLSFAFFLLTAGCASRPRAWSMEGAPGRGQKLVVFPPVVENASDSSVLTLQGALSGSILTHMGDCAVSSRVVWDQLAADFEGFGPFLFNTARDAFQARKRDLEDRELPGKDTALHREMDALGDRMALAFRLLHLEVIAPSHLLVTGIRLGEADAFSSRRMQVWAFVVDREKHRIALAVHLEFSASDSLYRQAQRLLYAGRDIAETLKPWFPQLPPAPVVRVPAQQNDAGSALPEKTEEIPEE